MSELARTWLKSSNLPMLDVVVMSRTIGHVVAIAGRLAVAGSFLSSRQPG
jgi:hypothetical protein